MNAFLCKLVTTLESIFLYIKLISQYKARSAKDLWGLLGTSSSIAKNDWVNVFFHTRE